MNKRRMKDGKRTSARHKMEIRRARIKYFVITRAFCIWLQNDLPDGVMSSKS